MALSFVTPEWIQSGDAGDQILNSRHVPYKMLVPTRVMPRRDCPSASCGTVRYFAVAVFRGEWRRMAVFGGFYRPQIRRNSTLFVRNCFAVPRDRTPVTD